MLSFLGAKMNEEQKRNVEQTIDDLCENLVWACAYFKVLSGLHLVAKASGPRLDSYPQLLSCLYHGMFDCLFIKINNFFDRRTEACGFPRLFKLLRRYTGDDTKLMAQVARDESRLKDYLSIEKVKNWRDEITAHLTQSYRSPDFFISNKLHLSELETLLNFVEQTVQSYSFKMLARINDTRNPSADVVKEIERLFYLDAEPVVSSDR
jgi:hypothetical protein